MKRKEERDKVIREEVRELVGRGYLVKQAIIIVAEKYYLSWWTVRKKWYEG